MTKDDIFSLVKQEIIDTLPLVDEEEIQQNMKLSDFGANSIDRVEIAINCMRKLDVKIDPSTLAAVKNISGLIDALFNCLNH